MPDPAAIGTGAGAGGGLLALAWLADRLWGSKPSKALQDAIEAVAVQVNKLYEWHAVADPDDATQRIWWISKRMRETFAETQELLRQLTELTEEINNNLAMMAEVTAQLRRDVAALRRGRENE